MNDLLLSTKFNIPPVNDRLVPRPKLFRQLDAGLRPDCLLTLISTPAGYGKTTLLSDWLHRSELQQGEDQKPVLRTAWISLEKEDNDLRRVLAYLVAAFQQAHPALGKGIMEAFQSSRRPDPRTLATWLINDLNAISGRMLLVLDDYHLVTSQEIHDLVSYVIDHQPAQLKIVIATRADPPLPLARLRARGQLNELRQEDLSFSRDEAADFFLEVFGIHLPEDQLAKLEERTEGWVAGLQLVGISFRKIDDLPQFIEAFSGGNAFIADFLTDEVLNQQPDRIKDFLLRTSILDRFSAPLCEAVTGREEVRTALGRLREENLFLIPLDQDGNWYRYHALFADMLRKRLQLRSPELISHLHSRAATWYGEQGYLSNAVEHALKGENFSYTLELISEVGETKIKQGEAQTLLRWLETLPFDHLKSDPVVMVYYGLVLLLSGRPLDRVKAFLDGGRATSKKEDAEGELAAFQGILAVMQGDPGESIRHSEKALETLPVERDLLRSLAADSLGMAYTLTGDMTEAGAAFEQVIQIAEGSGNVMMTIGALSNLAGILILQGKLAAAQRSYKKILELASEKMGDRSQLTGKALLGLGLLARERNELDEALAYYHAAARELAHSVEIGLPVVYLSIAMVQANQGNWEEAEKTLDEAHRYALKSTATPLDDNLTEETRLRFLVMRGEFDQAEQWLRSRGFFDRTPAEILGSGDPVAAGRVLTSQGIYLSQARFYLAKEAPEKALEIANAMAGLFEQKGHTRKMMEAMCLQALAFKQTGQTDKALDVLEKLVALAEPENFQRTFLDEGEPMAQLLYLGASKGLSPGYIGKLLSAFSADQKQSYTEKLRSDLDDVLVEALSERELEVLGLIAKGLSNREICERLHISLSTVKSHNAQIYGKLNVHNRTQAVAVARSLGLIPIL